MPLLELSPYPDNTDARRELVAFLERHWRAPRENAWGQRMRFWWDENPAAHENHERGRWVHAHGRVVGYGGSIPAMYAWQGRAHHANAATTLCVDEAVPKSAAMVFLKQREASKDRMIVHTTPNPRLQAALLKMGARAETLVTRHYLPAGAASLLHGRSWWPALPTDRRLIADPAAVTSLVRPFQQAERIEKWVTPEYLRWFCGSPKRAHHFLGTVDAAGVLSSYLLVTPRSIKGLRSWDVLETFTANDDDTELHALIGMLVKQPELLPGGARMITAATFPGDCTWDRAPAILRRHQQVCHFFLMPESLREAPKHTVMAEGDLGL